MDISHKIKTLILPIVCLIFLCFCGTDKDVKFSYGDGEDVKTPTEISYETGAYDWEIGEEVTVSVVCVPDKETAIKIAESITSGFQKKGGSPTMSLSMFSLTQKEKFG